MGPNGKSDFLPAALSLAEMGFHVVPADRRHPIVKGWPTAATREPEQIRKWVSQYAKASVSIVIRPDGDVWALDARSGAGVGSAITVVTSPYHFRLETGTDVSPRLAFPHGGLLTFE